MTKFQVVVQVGVDVDAWAEEYGVTRDEAVAQITSDLRDGQVFLFQHQQWSGLAKLDGDPQVSLLDANTA